MAHGLGRGAQFWWFMVWGVENKPHDLWSVEGSTILVTHGLTRGAQVSSLWSGWGNTAHGLGRGSEWETGCVSSGSWSLGEGEVQVR